MAMGSTNSVEASFRSLSCTMRGVIAVGVIRCGDAILTWSAA